jgi:hypothetical protein
VTVNSLSFKNVSLLLGITALTIASNPLSVGAQMPIKQSELASTPVLEVAPVTTTTANPVANQATTVAKDSDTGVAPNATGAAIIEQLGNSPAATTNAANTAVEIPVPPANLAQSQEAPQASVEPAQMAITPQPEKLQTSAAYLTKQPTASNSTASAQEADTTVAQNINTEINPGRATRGGSSYIGIGGNLGLSGSPALGDGAFMINSKIGLTRNISFRPAVLFGDDTDFLLPLTYDFVLESADPFAPIPFAPYLGGGVIVSTNGDNTLGFLLTGGVDVPLSSQFVANASINVGFRNDTDVGLMLGIGYTFPGFSR